jgi:hypothetical protein
MATSRNRKDHKAKVIKYKNQKLKTMSEQTQPQVPSTLPEVRERPTWQGNEILEISGVELEYIYNSIAGISNAVAALNSVLNNNMIKGKVKMSFDKLSRDAAGNPSYHPMTPEESAPYEADFNKVLTAARKAAEQITSSNIVIPTEDEVKQVEKDTKKGRKSKLEVVK